MLGKAVCGHMPALAPLPLGRAHDCRSAPFRPQAPARIGQNSRCRAANDADGLQLVSREGTKLSMPINLHAYGITCPGMEAYRYSCSSKLTITAFTKIVGLQHGITRSLNV